MIEAATTNGRFRGLRRHRLSPSRIPNADRVALVVLVLIAAVAGSLHLNRQALSLYDEVSFLGYVQLVTEGHVARNGDLLPSWPREYVACLPVQPHGLVTDVPCGEVVDDPGRYPFGGTRVAQRWPPTYFVIAAPVAAAADAIGIDVLAATRGVSLALFALGVLLVFTAARALGASTVTALAATVLLWALISGDLYSRFVTPHSMVPLLVGLSTLIVALRARGNLAFVPTIIALAVTMTLTALSVPHAVLPVSAIVLALAAWEALRRPNRARSIGRATGLVLLPFAAGVVFAAWTHYHSGLVGSNPEVLPPAFEEPMVTGIDLATRISRYAAYFWPGVIIGDPNAAPASRILVGVIASVAVILAVGAVLLRGRGATIERVLAVALLIGIVVCGVAFSFQIAYPPMRYAYGLAILAMILLAVGFKHSRIGARLLLGIALVAFLVALYEPLPPL